jgi:diadenosine tetraphosphate (Ap4A) HIT family hydrolase
MPTPLHARVQRLRDGADPALIARLPSGYAILANQQPEPITGCCMLLPDLPAHAGADGVPAHLNDLSESDRALFLTDWAALGDAVLAATACERVNYLILANQVPALHAHCVPRFAHEDAAKRLMDPFAAYDFPNARRAEPDGRDAALLDRLRAALAKRAVRG